VLVRSAVVVLLAIPLLAGCFGDDRPDPAPPASPHRVNDLDAPGARVSRHGDDLRILYEGELGAGAYVPLLGALPQSEAVDLVLPVDESVRHAVLDFSGSGTAAMTLRDAEGHLLCAARAGRVCATVINATDQADWPLRVTSLESGGLEFTLTVTLSGAPATRGTDPTRPANATVFVTDEEGGEPTLAALEDGRILVASGSGVLRFNPDGTYEDVTPPVDAAASQTLDPFLVGDPVSGRVYISQLASCMRLSWTDDGGDSWVTNPMMCGGPEQHHQKLAAGPGPLPGTRMLHIATMNLASWLLTDDVVIVHTSSHDNGATWVQRPAMVKETAGMEARAVGNIAVGPEGHVVYIIAYLCDGFVDAEYEGVAVGMIDGALRQWEWTRIAPGGGRCEGIDPGIATNSANVFAAWEDISAGVGKVWWASASLDVGGTWGAPHEIATPGLGSFAFTDLAASDSGLAALFLATPDTILGPTQAPGWARWYPYLATYDVATPSEGWDLVRIQDDPVQVGPICMDGPMCMDGARNLLDFVDVQFAPDGSIVMAYADGCEAECEMPWQSRGSDLRVAIVRP
jgi:hypothetical protein